MVLSYRHAFHAGNFADVVKHSALSLLLARFHRKPAPFYFLDTHAGGPIYNLRTAVEPQKTLEYAAGIGRIWHRRDYSLALSTVRRSARMRAVGSLLLSALRM